MRWIERGLMLHVLAACLRSLLPLPFGATNVETHRRTESPRFASRRIPNRSCLRPAGLGRSHARPLASLTATPAHRASTSETGALDTDAEVDPIQQGSRKVCAGNWDLERAATASPLGIAKKPHGTWVERCDQVKSAGNGSGPRLGRR